MLSESMLKERKESAVRDKAQNQVSQSIGQCAHKWKEKYPTTYSHRMLQKRMLDNECHVHHPLTSITMGFLYKKRETVFAIIDLALCSE